MTNLKDVRIEARPRHGGNDMCHVCGRWKEPLAIAVEFYVAGSTGARISHWWPAARAIGGGQITTEGA
jgi:hypothetical protein